MKFICVKDTTKKFTEGKEYEVPGVNHAKHNAVIIDDAGRKRLATITHGGKGLRYQPGGKRIATFEDQEVRSAGFRINVTGWRIDKKSDIELNALTIPRKHKVMKMGTIDKVLSVIAVTTLIILACSFAKSLGVL